jgi:hypothetical protein
MREYWARRGANGTGVYIRAAINQSLENGESTVEGAEFSRGTQLFRSTGVASDNSKTHS